MDHELSEDVADLPDKEKYDWKVPELLLIMAIRSGITSYNRNLLG